MELELVVVRTERCEEASIESSVSDEYEEACAIAIVNPSDAERLGVRDGDVVVVETAEGRRVRVRAVVSDEVLEGSLVMPLSLWSMVLAPSTLGLSGVKVRVRRALASRPNTVSELLTMLSLAPSP